VFGTDLANNLELTTQDQGAQPLMGRSERHLISQHAHVAGFTQEVSA
jgi:hypothetical protein